MVSSLFLPVYSSNKVEFDLFCKDNFGSPFRAGFVRHFFWQGFFESWNTITPHTRTEEPNNSGGSAYSTMIGDVGDASWIHIFSGENFLGGVGFLKGDRIYPERFQCYIRSAIELWIAHAHQLRMYVIRWFLA